jgi:hypothetical protein
MAVAFRAAATASATSSPSSVTVTKPTGTVDDDVMLGGVVGDGGSSTSPAGWSAVQQLPSSDADEFLDVYRKVAASEGPNYQFNLSGAFEVVAAIVTYSGASTSAPINASSERAGGSDEADPQTVNATAITPSVNDCMIVYFGAVDLTNTATVTWTPPSGYTERVDEDGPNGLCPLEVAELLQTSATSTGTVGGVADNNNSRTGETLAILVALAPAGGGGGGTVHTETLTDTLTIGDERVSGMVRNQLLSDTLLVTEGSTIVSTIHGYIFSDEIVVSDASAQFFVRTRIAESGIVITDELLATIIGNVILTRVLSDDIVVTDGTIWSAIRGRIMQDTITLSEGATEIYTTTNMLATDEVLLDDSLVVRRWLTRLLTESIDVTDEAIAAIVGQNVLTRLLTDTIETVDQALVWCQRHRVGESMVLTTDEIVKVMHWTRELTDSIDLADENLTAIQRFIMLSDALTVTDSAVASINPQPDDFVTPTIRIGFDQPRIVIGGYAVN